MELSKILHNRANFYRIEFKFFMWITKSYLHIFVI